MTTPIERAAEPAQDAYEAIDSIDVEQLAKVIEAYKSRGVGSAGIAQTVKNWLTGKTEE